MRQKIMMMGMALAGGMIALGSYRLFFDDTTTGSWPVDASVPVYNANYAPLPVDGSIDFTSAAERTVNTVVHVKTQMSMQPAYNPWMDFFGYQQQEQVQMSSGSGVIISGDGYIITNNHVVEGADKLMVTLNNNMDYEATVVGRDPSTDIAVIKIDAKSLPSITWGNSEDVKIGQWVIAVGNPFDLTSTVTAGIVSAKARNINLLGGNRNTTEEIFPIESFIQTDAAVNPGNSGGALVNTRGELVGINTAIASRSGSFNGYAFAVPSTIARKVAQDLIEFGHVQRAFIGVQISDVSQDQAKELGLKDVSGVYVKSLTEGGAAVDSGIRQGDVIQKVGEVSVKNVPELQEQVSKFRPGDKIKVGVWRDNKQQIVDVTLRNRSGKAQLENFAADAEASFQSLGATFVAPSYDDKNALGISGGAKISDIQQGKFKSLGMQKGFIITRIGDQKINSPEELKAALSGKEGSYVEVRGMYANGMEAMYGFKL